MYMTTEYMTHDDFVLTQQEGENGEKIFVGGGYTIDSYLLKTDTPVMTTFNNNYDNDDDQDNENNLVGGKQVSSPFENLAVPAGLFFINQKSPKHNYHEKTGNYNMISDDIHDKLFDLINYDKKKHSTNKKRSKKNIIKTKLKKTYKNRKT